MPNRCFVCYSAEKLTPQKLSWPSMDEQVEIEITKCKDCIKELEELEAYNSDNSWVKDSLKKLLSSEKAKKATTTLMPIGLIFKEVIS